jgi:hypothetical protein
MKVTLEHVARLALPRLKPGRVLADPERETLIRMAEVLLEGCPVGISMAQVADNFERFLVLGRSKRAWRCRLLLTLVEYAPMAAYGRPLRLLSKEDRRRFVADKLMKGGPLWSLCAKVRYFALLGAYGDQAGSAATGFIEFPKRKRAVAQPELGGEAA